MDERIFSQLVLEHQDMLFRVSYTLLHHTEDCKDALQDALVKAWNNIHTLRKPEAFRSWITRIVVNTCKDMLRKKRFQTVELREDMPAPQEQVQNAELASALDNLEEGLRLPVVLHYMEGLSVEAIARVLRIPQGTVKNRLYRGRQKLATTLDGYQKEVEAWN